MIKLAIHSITDLVTNSSTVIYTYSEGSLKALEEMIDEFFKTFGVNKKCKDVFGLYVTLDDPAGHLDDIDEEDSPEFNDLDWKQKQEYIDKTIKKVALGEIPEPIWLTKLNDHGNHSYDNFPPATTLYIVPRAPEYEKLAKLVSKFLYSTKSDGGFDG